MAFKSEIHVAELASIRIGHTEGDIYYILDNGMLGDLPCKPGDFVEWHNNDWRMAVGDRYALKSEIGPAGGGENKCIVFDVDTSHGKNYPTFQEINSAIGTDKDAVLRVVNYTGQSDSPADYFYLARYESAPSHHSFVFRGINRTKTVNSRNEWTDTDNKYLEAGNGINIENGVVSVDTPVEETVETVEKLSRDLDTKLTVNFDMPGISAIFDFADSSVTTLSNGATMLCQAFTVPINSKIRAAAVGRDDATLLGIYAKQGYGSKIMLALYAFNFTNNERTYGTTDYVGDTGPVSVTSGLNQFPLKNINPNITELESDKVYYACLYLPSQHSNGLLLAGCQGYGSDTVNATPRFTTGVENIQNDGSEIDMNDPTSGLYYNDGNGNYYIGPWNEGYNEIPSVPRFFLQIRNGDATVSDDTGPFYVVNNFALKATSTVQTIFGDSLTALNSGMVFQAVTPRQDVSIKKWVVLDTNPDDYSKFGGDIYSADFGTRISSRDNCSVSVAQYGTVSGITLYAHEYTPNTPVNLTANTTYRFPSCSVAGALSAVLVQYDTPVVEKTLHLFESAYNVSQWVQDYVRANNVQGPYLKVFDTDDNAYVI